MRWHGTSLERWQTSSRPFFIGSERQHFTRLVDELREIEVDVVQIEPPDSDFSTNPECR